MLIVKGESLFTLVLFRGKIRKFLEEPDWQNLERVLTQHKQLKKYNGGHLTRRPSAMPLKEIKEIKYFDWPIYPDKDTLFWFREACRVAQENGVKVLIVNAPILEEIMYNRDRDGGNQRYTTAINQLVKEFDNVEIMPPLLRSYGLDHFEDWHHLNQKGAQRFIKELTKEFTEYVKTDLRP